MSLVSRFREKYLTVTPKPRTLADAEGVVFSELDASGAEVLDPTPLEPPLGYKRQPSLAEQIRQMVISERLAQEALAMGAETFEEADDFDVDDDDFDPRSPWENDYDPPLREMIRDGEESLRFKAEENKKARDQRAPVMEPAKPAKSAKRSSEPGEDDNQDD